MRKPSQNLKSLETSSNPKEWFKKTPKFFEPKIFIRFFADYLFLPVVSVLFEQIFRILLSHLEKPLATV